MPKLTIAICTRDRPDQIGRASDSVVASGFGTEILVVDQSSGRATEEIVCQQRYRNDIHYLRSDTVGLSNARNVALLNATSDIVAFTDDDCAVPGEWASSIIEFFAHDPALGAVFGPVVAAPGYAAEAGWLPAYRPAKGDLLTGPRSAPLTGPMGANMAFRRTAVNMIGGFDPWLGAGATFKSAEDIDALYRVLLIGMHVRVSAEVPVLHFGYREYASGAGARALWDTMLGNGAYYGKHVKCGDALALMRFARQLDRAARSIAHKLKQRSRPRGLRQPALMLEGFSRALLWPVDARNRLFGRRASPDRTRHVERRS